MQEDEVKEANGFLAQFSARLRAYLAAEGISGRQVSDRLGRAPSVIAAILKGGNFRMDLFHQLLTEFPQLNDHLSWLIHGTGSPPLALQDDYNPDDLPELPEPAAEQPLSMTLKALSEEVGKSVNAHRLNLGQVMELAGAAHKASAEMAIMQEDIVTAMRKQNMLEAEIQGLNERHSNLVESLEATMRGKK